MNPTLMADFADSKLSANQIILIFIGIMGTFLLFMGVKKIYYYVKFRKRFYIFPKIDSKGIANVAMIISISISIIILLTVLTAGLMGILFRAYPG
jgi:amino acid permease